MNRWFWKVLGLGSTIAAIHLSLEIPKVLATLPPARQTESLLFGIGLVGVCSASAILCFFPRSYPVTLRILGLVGLAGCIFNIYESFRRLEFSRLVPTLGFWLPGSIYLIVQGDMGSTKNNE
uniref:Uncharacterized protein n=1 Tax=Cyanothece sp. (strain PCC 7425 / ATCC 29141) TaxID=395961 RepID=B8HSN1_CYAP4